MSVDAIVFDLDGTLVDSHRDIMTSVLMALADQGLDQLSLADLDPYLGFPLSELYAELLPKGGKRGLQRFVHLYRAHYCDHCADTTRPYAGIVYLLDALAGRALAVATAKPTWSAVQILERLGLAERFTFITGSENHKSKPDPGVLLHACQKLGVAPGKATMIGDTDRDVQAAQAAGMRAVAVTWGGWSREKLAPLGPDALVDEPAEILKLVQ